MNMTDTKSEPTFFELGMKHQRAGIPREKNPCVIACVNDGMRSEARILKQPKVVAWFAGWDTAKASRE
jgi:hypothetical protein